MKKCFASDEKLKEIASQYPTPFHLYDEEGIRRNVRHLHEAFAWNKGFKEYFAVKANPNPTVLKILHEEGCGADCSSLTELMLSEAVGLTGDDIMFSSNATPDGEFAYARKLGAYINLDDITHIDLLEKEGGIPDIISCRFNPGGYFVISNKIMDNPGEAKYTIITANCVQQKYCFVPMETQNLSAVPRLLRIILRHWILRVYFQKNNDNIIIGNNFFFYYNNSRRIQFYCLIYNERYL